MKCWKTYMRLATMLVLAAAALIVPMQIEDAFLRERVATTTDAVDMLAAGVEAFPGRPWYDHELNIRDAVEHLDQLYQVYAAAFKSVGDGGPVQITGRYYETSPFEPYDYSEFAEAASSMERGHIVVNYAPENQGYRDLHLYFRWMPLYSGSGERYLVVTGVSKHSIISRAYVWLTIGLWVVTIAVAIPTVRKIMRSCCTDAADRRNRDGGRSPLSKSKKSG